MLTSFLALLIGFSNSALAEIKPEPLAAEKIEKMEERFVEIQKESDRQKRLVGGLFSVGALGGIAIAVTAGFAELAEQADISNMLYGSAVVMVAGTWILGSANSSEKAAIYFQNDREYSVEGIQRTVQYGEERLESIAKRARMERIVDSSLLVLAGGYNLSLSAKATGSESIRPQVGSSGLAFVVLGSLLSVRERRLESSGLVAAAGAGNLMANSYQRGNPSIQYLQYSGFLWLGFGIWEFITPRVEETAHREHREWLANILPTPGGALFQVQMTY